MGPVARESGSAKSGNVIAVLRYSMIGVVDIGGTKMAGGMVTESGQVLARKKSPTDTASYANGLSTIGGLLRETAQIAGVEITGIGIGSTGPVDPFTGKFGEVDFLPGWRGQNPVEDLARMFRVQVALENDADAAAPAEAGWAAGNSKSRPLYFTVATRISPPDPFPPPPSPPPRPAP